MISLRIGLMLWAVAGPLLAGGVVYAAMLLRETIVVNGAVTAARNEEVSICNDSRREIAATITSEVEKARAEALAAADAERPTPAVPSEIVVLCNESASCRDRRAP